MCREPVSWPLPPAALSHHQDSVRETGPPLPSLRWLSRLSLRWGLGTGHEEDTPLPSRACPQVRRGLGGLPPYGAVRPSCTGMGPKMEPAPGGGLWFEEPKTHRRCSARPHVPQRRGCAPGGSLCCFAWRDGVRTHVEAGAPERLLPAPTWLVAQTPPRRCREGVC